MRFIRKGVPPKERELDGKVKRRQKEQMTAFSPKGRDKGRRDGASCLGWWTLI